MKSLIFDAGPVISLATNNLLSILEPLKKKFNGKFYLTESVKRELVDRPFEIKKFKFEAIQVEKLIEDEILEIIDTSFIRQETPKLLELANSIFKAFNHDMHIVHFAEMSVIASAIDLKADAVVLDEKTTRLLIENPRMIFEILKRSLRTPISINESNLKEFRNKVTNMKTIRSVELVTLAYEQGFLDKYITRIPNPKKSLLESVLWGVKLNGCAISREEIDQIITTEIK